MWMKQKCADDQQMCGKFSWRADRKSATPSPGRGKRERLTGREEKTPEKKGEVLQRCTETNSVSLRNRKMCQRKLICSQSVQ